MHNFENRQAIWRENKSLNISTRLTTDMQHTTGDTGDKVTTVQLQVYNYYVQNLLQTYLLLQSVYPLFFSVIQFLKLLELTNQEQRRFNE